MTELETIYHWLKTSKCIVITAGAGIGVDSGLASYRGDGGQWGSVETDTHQSVFEVVNPSALVEHPEFGWKMFASRLIEYTKTEPHHGFQILRSWIEQFQLDSFVLTSNVDQHFLKSGFHEDTIRELHGSLFYLQCSEPCHQEIWQHHLNLETIMVDIENRNYPTCPKCGKISRPNVYMFRDNTYLPQRSDRQKEKFESFLNRNKDHLMLVIEIGSGPHVQSIRKKTRMLGIDYHANILRINTKDSKIKPPHIGISKGALEALSEIDLYIKEREKGIQGNL